MVQIPTWSVVFLALMGFQKPEDSVLHRSSTLKILETEHLRIFYTGEFMEGAKAMGRRGETFLEDLAKQWGIVLPNTPIAVSIIRVQPSGPWIDHDFDPPWLASGYETQGRRVELRAKPADFHEDPVYKALKHHLIHALLNRRGTQALPPFIEEGLARYYAGSRGSRQVYLAVLGFNRVENLRPFLNNPFTYQIPQDYQYAGALGYQFIQWLWVNNPPAEKAFLQSHLEGKTLEASLGSAGLPSLDQLIAEFDRVMRPQFGLARLFKTYDFWLLTCSVLILLAMAFKLRSAYRNSRMTFVELVEVEPEPIPKELFQGPAFNPIPDVAPLDLVPQGLPNLPEPPSITHAKAQKNRSPELYDDVAIPPLDEILRREDSISTQGGHHLDTGEFENLGDQLDAAFDRIGLPNAPPPIDGLVLPAQMVEGGKAAKLKDESESDSEIDSEVDGFFDRIT